LRFLQQFTIGISFRGIGVVERDFHVININDFWLNEKRASISIKNMIVPNKK